MVSEGHVVPSNSLRVRSCPKPENVTIPLRANPMHVSDCEQHGDSTGTPLDTRQDEPGVVDQGSY